MTSPDLTDLDLRDAEQILADLNDLATRLKPLAPVNPAFYAVNRAHIIMIETCDQLKAMLKAQ